MDKDILAKKLGNSVKGPETPPMLLQLKEPNKLKFSMALIEAGFTAEAVSSFVHAVNSHEALLQAAKNIRDEIMRCTGSTTTAWDRAIAQAGGE